MDTKKRIKVLISPLEWGLGHATRTGRIIKHLLAHDCEVIVAADGLPLNLLQSEFPNLQFLKLPFYTIRYSKSRSGFFIQLLTQLPGIFKAIKKTRPLVKQLVDEHQIDLIISDNRYGFYDPRIPSAFITHQLQPKPPRILSFLEYPFALLHMRLLKKYARWWVADYPGEENVAGSLSHLRSVPKQVRYLDPVSWLADHDISKEPDLGHFDNIFILSGPEPQRSILERKILDQADRLYGKSLLLQGLPARSQPTTGTIQKDNITVVNHLPRKEMHYYLTNTPNRILRAGVVSVFDLAVLGLPALLIPTPGQTEQEYVAKRLCDLGYHYYCDQENYDPKKIKDYQSRSYKKFPAAEASKIDLAITELIRLSRPR